MYTPQDSWKTDELKEAFTLGDRVLVSNDMNKWGKAVYLCTIPGEYSPFVVAPLDSKIDSYYNSSKFKYIKFYEYDIENKDLVRNKITDAIEDFCFNLNVALNKGVVIG